MRFAGLGIAVVLALPARAQESSGFRITEDDERIRIVGSAVEASIKKKGYVSGVEGGSFLDRKTGARDLGFGLDIVDWIMEPGSDEAYREKLPGDLPYRFGNAWHGNIPKRSIEGPQICTKARALSPRVIRGKGFVAVKMDYRYRVAAPGRKTGSTWDQTLVFPAGKRYFISSDRITSVNASDAMFLRIDMPGHVKHQKGDTFSELYLSYHGRIPSSEFRENFPPDAKFRYARGGGKLPKRIIRAYRIRDPKTGKEGPWLAGMTLDPSVVYDAWCHQRGYVCFIQEFGGRAVRPGESFSAAFIVGFFDSIEEMHEVYDRHAGHTGLEVDDRGWRLTGKRDRKHARRPEIRVGIDEGDLRGNDHRVLQAAVDQMAALGGGVVRVGPGRFLMRNALSLKSNVDVLGTPGKTILAACDGVRSRLHCDGDCNERQITLRDPTGFRIGDGVAVRDKNYRNGFTVTTATLTARVDERTFRLSKPLYLDYMVTNEATASLSFPVVGGWDVKNITLEGLTIEGNKEKTLTLDGCRGGGIYLFDSADVVIRNCVVRNYNGDGISWQTSNDVRVEDCLAEGNAGLGIHPGSGSQRPVVRNCRSFGNGSDGLYVCWRVKHGLFEKNLIRGNGRAGISIGHKDTDNLFRENTIVGNARTGVLFRRESAPMGAHRNVFERNTILDNGAGHRGKGPAAAVTIQGHHNDVIFRNNTIGNTKDGGPTRVGISVGKEARSFGSRGNTFRNVETKLRVEK